jgi:ferrous iron transport protein B
MFNLFTPPCFAALGAMNSEMGDAKWFWGGVGLQFATGYSVAFIVYQLGTLFTAGKLGAGFVPGLIAVSAMIAVIVILMVKAKVQDKVEYTLE